EPATRKVFVRPDQRADHLVQRVVPADILSHDTNAFARYDPSGGVHAAGLTIDVLMVVNCAQGIVQLARAEGQAARDTRWGTYRILEGCCTAQPTARARARVSFTAQQLGEAVSSDADAHLESTIVVPQSLKGEDLARALDDAFAQGESGSEIFEIRRRSQHHDVRDTVVGQRDGHFLGNLIDNALEPSVAPPFDDDLRARWGRGRGDDELLLVLLHSARCKPCAERKGGSL